jgi:hypothetical protein
MVLKRVFGVRAAPFEHDPEDRAKMGGEEIC